jgi:hypothetical protein
MSNPSNFTDLLNSPGVWTGKSGVTAVTNLLSNPALQDKIQQGLMQSSYTTLVQTGQIVTPGTDTVAPTGQIFNGVTGGFSSSTTAFSSFSTGWLSGIPNSGNADLGGLLANASKFGVGPATAWAKGALPSIDTGSIKTQMDSLAKQGQFAVNFSDFKLPAAVTGVIPAAGFEGTIDRSTLNAAFAKLVGSDKIPVPEFSPQAVNTTALSSASMAANSLLSSSSPRATNGIGSSLLGRNFIPDYPTLSNAEFNAELVTANFPTLSNAEFNAELVTANFQPVQPDDGPVSSLLRNSLPGAIRNAANSAQSAVFPKGTSVSQIFSSTGAVLTTLTNTIPENSLTLGEQTVLRQDILRNSLPGAVRNAANSAQSAVFPTLKIK